MNWLWIISPLVGCVIGYITNYLAIKMLFRPHEAVKIGKFTLPFTPGLIPRNRGRLAAAIGDVISRELLSGEVVEAALTSDDMMKKAAEAIDNGMDALLNESAPAGEVIARFAGEAAYREKYDALLNGLTASLSQKLAEADLGQVTAKAITEYALRKSPSALQGLISGLLDENKRLTVTYQLREAINQYVARNGEAMVRETLSREGEKLLTTPLGETLGSFEKQRDSIREGLLSGYGALVRSGVQRAMDAFDISAVVRERISSFDSRTIEQLVFSVMDKELKAIVWLGAGLGFIMGFVNLLFV